MVKLKISIVDVHGLKDRTGIEYVGRRGQYHTWAESVLGNPFTLQKHGQKALALYANYLDGRIFCYDAKSLRIGNELCRLLSIARSDQGLKLGCWCVNDPDPLAHTETVCHAQIIARKLAEMAEIVYSVANKGVR